MTVPEGPRIPIQVESATTKDSLFGERTFKPTGAWVQRWEVYAQGIGRPGLHGESVKSTSWWACEYLERPPDAYVMWHYGDLILGPGCRPCLAKARHQARLFPDDPHVTWLVARLEEGMR